MKSCKRILELLAQQKVLVAEASDILHIPCGLQ